MIPILIGNLFQQAYTLADRISLGGVQILRYKHGAWNSKKLV